MTSYKWIIAGLCFTLLFMAAGTQYAFGVFLLPMSREFGWSISSIALAATLCMFVTGFSCLIIGKVADRYGARNTVLIGSAVAGVSILLLAFVSSLWQVYLLFGLLFGFTWQGSCMIATQALLSRWFLNKRSIGLTILLSGFPMGWLCIVPIAERLILTYGWRNSLLILGIVFLFAVLITSFMLREPTKVHFDMSGDGAGRTVALGAAIKTSFFLMFGIIHIVCGLTDIPFTRLWVPLSLEWGIDEVTASYTLGSMGAIVFLGTIMLGPLPERFGKKIPFTLSYVVRTFSLVIPLLLVRSITTYYVFTVIIGFSFFGMVPISSAWLGEVFGEKSVGSLIGFISFVHNTSAAIGIYLFSFLAENYGTYYLAFLLSFIMNIIVVVFCLLLKPAKIEG